jgi:hypothetical protein
MHNWEYLVTEFETSLSMPLQSWLNDVGASRWELVVLFGGPTTWRALFKRPALDVVL